MTDDVNAKRWPRPYDRYAVEMLEMQVPWSFVMPWITYMRHERLGAQALFDGLALHNAGLAPTRAIDYVAFGVPPVLAGLFDHRGWSGRDAQSLICALAERNCLHKLPTVERWLSLAVSPRKTVQYLKAGVGPDGIAALEERRRAGPAANRAVDEGLDLIIALTRPLRSD